jgi:hypothetical protein
LKHVCLLRLLVRLLAFPGLGARASLKHRLLGLYVIASDASSRARAPEPH